MLIKCYPWNNIFPPNNVYKKGQLLKVKDNKAVTRICLNIPKMFPKMQTEWLCGYVAFKIDQPLELDLDDIEVHGGITYFERCNGYEVYGFDCGHAFDYDNPRCYDPEWVMSQCENLEKQIEEKSHAN